MKRFLIAAAMAVFAVGPARADVVDYAELFGGITQDPDLGSPPPSTFEMDLGYNVGAALGWNLTPQFAIEADFFYTESDFNGFNDSIDSFTGMVDGIYTIDVGSSIRPYVGVGAGFAQVTFSNHLSGLSDSDVVFAYQGMVGFLTNIDQQLDLLVEYRYQGANDASLSLSGIPFDQEYESHNLSVGLRFNL